MSTTELDDLAELRKIARANSEAIDDLMRSPKQLSIKVRHAKGRRYVQGVNTNERD